MNKTLHAGERFIFNEYYTFSILTRDSLEVYALGSSRRNF